MWVRRLPSACPCGARNAECVSPAEKRRVAATLLYHSDILALHAGVIVLMGPNVIQRPPEETIMNRRIAMVVALVVVAVALAGVIGTTAYRAGLTRGLTDAGTNVPGPWLYHGPFGYPGPLAFLFPLLGLFVILAVVRGLFFWRGWCAGARGSWKSGVPPMFEEWHRGAHQSPPPGDAVR